MDEQVTTEDEARAAEAAADAAEAEAVRLARTAPHDDGISLEHVEQAEHAGRVARFVAARVRAKAERAKVAAAVQARRALRAEVLAASSATVVDELCGLLDTISRASAEFVDRVQAHNAQVRDWNARAKALGVPGRGVVSPEHEGLGLDAAGAILVDDGRVGSVNAANTLGHMFTTVQNGLMPTRDGSGLAAAHRAVGKIGAL